MDYNTNLDYAQVLFVKIEKFTENLCDFHVTVRHNDQGWDHYANLWEIVNPASGEVLGTRTLLHPHDVEQPFTRSLLKAKIPPAVNKLFVRARCNLHGFEGKEVLIDFNQLKSEFYEIIK